ncbi:uncharacterized protein SPSK_10071 [Sporothrix schenckii 1099-18]|uniref:Secreted protein n=1 Tax=Sporothrix schenckii 1099-18 TaxID=1397361 RepID=A0A0F2M7B0_SPOSC|nr:uncharacterized protein SPSK_10071 [Sporothrix schenckii 1099-18]KJR84954.1 hypothetical protein SPSK_10071 [Sporothrix schenckii 1099-18]
MGRTRARVVQHAVALAAPLALALDLGHAVMALERTRKTLVSRQGQHGSLCTDKEDDREDDKKAYTRPAFAAAVVDEPLDWERRIPLLGPEQQTTDRVSGKCWRYARHDMPRGP